MADEDTNDNEPGGEDPGSGDVRAVSIVDEMKRSYLDYAMSVIVSRALPDVRDGLKPVHRRILYGMHEMGVHWNRSYKKSARVVGDVIGKYHPHGDSSIYDTLVRMAQPFSMRYMLVDGQGNFGSVDGDAPAAMRYTEVRLARIAHEILADLDKETVNFTPNYDETESEPSVMPTWEALSSGTVAPSTAVSALCGLDAVGNTGENVVPAFVVFHNPPVAYPM